MSGKAPQIKYDVFVSFRGKDIRHDFLSHLIDAFRRKQIDTFVDDKLERGDEISSSLFGAIETSLISLIIFSEDYASSRWCLEELEKIVECRDKYGQTVIPIFYNVDPTNVRHQKESYENALAEQVKKYNLTRVQLWRDALNKSANLSGIKSSDFRNDAELCDEIIKTVNHQLMMRLNKQPIQSKGLVGIDKPLAHLESLLRQHSKDVRVIGIWGMGGIGKTTIAQEVFNKLSSEYDGGCFLQNVREVSERAGGTNSLQEKLFSTLLGECVKIDTANGLPDYVRRRLGRMKVLIVLDDVNDSEQLEKVVGNHDSFGSGSRIILTTRDKQVIANEVDDDDIYKVGELDPDEALRLFNLNAFKQDHLEMEYSEHSKRVVNYAHGIPLVLKVLGRLLCGKGKEIWESLLDKLKRMPNKDVHKKMRLSYDDLDRGEKKIFLDVACFFSGLNLKLDWIKILLKDRESDNSAAFELERLKDKALITFSPDNVVSVHDILKEMAWEIVRQESGEDLGSHRRLEDHDDIDEVLKNDKGFEAIRSIWVRLSEDKQLELSPHTFAKMSKLRFLYFRYGSYWRDTDSFDILPQGLQSLPTGLRYLSWEYYRLKSLPQNFSAEKLVILDLSYNRLEKLWDGVQTLVNLKEVNLHWSRSLKELPDFSKATNLEVLNISGCVELISVHPYIFSLYKFQKLDASHCSSLTRLASYTHLTSLNYLNLESCSNLREFSVTSENMIELNLKLTGLDALPASFGHQSKLEILDLEGCHIQSLPSSINFFTRLRYLSICNCEKLQTLPQLPPSLETLLARGCRSLETVLFPSTATEQFNENRRRVEFWDCWNLDKDSYMAIELNAQINVMNLAHQHISTPEYDSIENYDDRATYVYVYPKVRVPKWLTYKMTNDHVIIDLSSAPPSSPLGFIFCFIIGKRSQTLKSLKLNIIISDGEGEGNIGSVDIYVSTDFVFTKSDNVCVMYDQRCSRYLNSRAKTQTRFKIKVTASSTLFQRGLNLGGFALEGFAVSPMSTLAYRDFIHEMGFA